MDTLAPFPFLEWTYQEEVSLILFTDFNWKIQCLLVSCLRYADNNTLLIGEPTVDNLWMMKAILRWYEYAFNLKVNFCKSSSTKVNFERSFFDLAAKFCNCKPWILQFKYPSLLVCDRCV